jgi:hypothetical protein
MRIILKDPSLLEDIVLELAETYAYSGIGFNVPSGSIVRIPEALLDDLKNTLEEKNIPPDMYSIEEDM